MSEILKPDFTLRWAQAGAVLAPSASKIQVGWTSEIPPHQWENWTQKRQDDAIAYLYQNGVAEYDVLTNYYAEKSIAKGANGELYICLADNGPDTIDGVQPLSSSAYWREMYAPKFPAGVIPTSDIGPIIVAGEGLMEWEPIANQYVAKGGGAKGGGADKVFYLNDKVVTTNYTLVSTQNAMTAGPIEVEAGVEIVVEAGATWTIV